jgi:hypothetical protein
MTYQPLVAPPAPSLALEAANEALGRLVVELASELAVYRPPRPPEGWERVGAVAERLGLRPVTIYRAAREGRIASAKIGPCLWVEPVEVRPARKAYNRRG